MMMTTSHPVTTTKEENIQTKKELKFLQDKANLFGKALVNTTQTLEKEQNNTEIQKLNQMLETLLANNQRLEELTSTTLHNTDTIMATTDVISTNVSTVLHEQRQSFSRVIKAVTKLQNTYNQPLNCSQLQNVPRCLLRFIQLLFQLLQLILYMLYNLFPSNVAKTIGVTKIPWIGTFLLFMSYLLDLALTRLIAAYLMITLGVSKDDEDAEQQLLELIRSTSFFITTGIIQICKQSRKFMFSFPKKISNAVFQGIIDTPEVNATMEHVQESFQTYTNNVYQIVTNTAATKITEILTNNTNSLLDNGKQLIYEYTDVWKMLGFSSSAASYSVGVGGGGDLTTLQTQADALLTETGFLYEFCTIQLNQMLLIYLSSQPQPLMVGKGGRPSRPSKKSKRCRRHTKHHSKSKKTYRKIRTSSSGREKMKR